jgi:hypothetical protein
MLDTEHIQLIGDQLPLREDGLVEGEIGHFVDGCNHIHLRGSRE